MMDTKMRPFGVLAAVGAAAVVLGFAGGASAQQAYYPDGTPYYAQPAPGYASGGRALTVTGRYRRPVVVAVAPAYDPYDGPKAVITAPIAAASTLVALPFRVVNGLFPAYGNPAQDPRVLVGAPVHAAGQIAQLPFRVIETPFRGSFEGGYPAY